MACVALSVLVIMVGIAGLGYLGRYLVSSADTSKTSSVDNRVVEGGSYTEAAVKLGALPVRDGSPEAINVTMAGLLGIGTNRTRG